MARIADYIAQIDRPPRQVLIEAHVLQVTLDDTTRCGVNLTQLVSIANAKGVTIPAKALTLKTTGFADASAESAFLATLNGTDLGGVIEALANNDRRENTRLAQAIGPQRAGSSAASRRALGF